MYRLSSLAPRGKLLVERSAPRISVLRAHQSSLASASATTTTRTLGLQASSCSSLGSIRTIFASPKEYSSLEYPNATEPPEITKTIAAQVRGQAPHRTAAVALPADPYRVTEAVAAETVAALRARPLSSGVSTITHAIPAEIPPNVPADQLETPETIVTQLDNGVRVVR